MKTNIESGGVWYTDKYGEIQQTKKKSYDVVQ